MSKKSQGVSISTTGISPCFLLFLVFLILKLCGVIAWSWWWVTAPLWGGVLFVLAVFLIALAVLLTVGVGKAVLA